MKRNYYFSAFVPAQEGGYIVLFPDFPEACTQGESIEECMENAEDVLACAVTEYTKARKSLPNPSALREAKAKVQKDMANLLEKEFPLDECLWQLFHAPEVDTIPVKITISLSKSVLSMIDNKARQAGYTRSGFIAQAAELWRAQERFA